MNKFVGDDKDPRRSKRSHPPKSGMGGRWLTRKSPGVGIQEKAVPLSAIKVK
jgi:hypothetical protein